jgi:hypothetical protein
MRKSITTALTAAAGIATLVAGGAITAAPAAQADVLGCEPGYGCIFAKPGTPLGQPGTIIPFYHWLKYGPHNIDGMYGVKDVCNQQTGKAVMRLYAGSAGTGKLLYTVKSGDPYLPNCRALDLTKVNSVVLAKS